MGIKSALRDPEVSPIFYIPIFWIITVLVLILIPPTREFIMNTWLLFGAANALIMMGTLIGGKIKFDMLAAIAVIVAFITGPIGTTSILSVAVFLDMQIRKELRRHRVT